ncbi:hypothetical protein HDZ31DRAFT_38773 [Schizophyllum fasciatum]
MKRGFLKSKSLDVSKRTEAPASAKETKAPTATAAPLSATSPKTPSVAPKPSATQNTARSSSRVPAPPNVFENLQGNLPANVSIHPMGRDASGNYTQPMNAIDLNSLDQGSAAELLKLAGLSPDMLAPGALGDIVSASELRIVTVPAQRPFIAAVPPRVANQIENSPRLCRPYAPPAPARHAIARSPVAGLGLFAARAVPRGAEVLREPPMALLAQALAARAGEHPVRAAEALAERVCAALGAEDRAAFLAFENCKPAQTHGVKRGILDTNSSAVPEGGVLKGPYAAVTRDISRVNHSCEPNAQAIWDVETMTFGLIATKPIKEGEEIFIAYTDPDRPKPERQHALWAMYSFRCACPKCSRQ